MSVLDKFKKKKAAKQSTTTTRSRSAVTGKLVSADEAKKNPNTTVTETVKKAKVEKLSYTEQLERDEKKRVEALLADGWFYTEWGELVPPIVEIDNKKPAEDK